MIDKEAELLRAVAEAAFGLRESSGMTSMGLERTLDALSAYRAQPQEAEGETVEVRAGVMKDGTEIYVVDANNTAAYRGTHIATITARVPLPVIPTISAKVVT